jgi:hypothetical protein
LDGDKRDLAYESVQNYAEIERRQISPEYVRVALPYMQMMMFRRNEDVALRRRFNSNIAGRIMFSAGGAVSPIQTLTRFAVVLAMLSAAVTPAVAQQQQSNSFEVPKNDSAKAEALANELAALSPRVDRKEATLLADCAYANVSRLRRQYRMFGTPIFNNFLVYHGLRKRGYCYQWTADLLVALDALKLTSLELHWGESYAGTWRENNCVVVTAKGQPFDRGIILDAWRHFGHLHWNLVLSDEDRYFENSKYAQRIRNRAAQRARHGVSPSNRRTLGANHPVAFRSN